MSAAHFDGYAEGRLYANESRDLARALRFVARRFGWAETGPLSGPLLQLDEPRRAVRLCIEVRATGKGTWVLVRSRLTQPFAVADLVTASVIARLFQELEGETLDHRAEARVVLPEDMQHWPADPGSLDGSRGRPVHALRARAWLRLPLAVGAVFAFLSLAGAIQGGTGLFGLVWPGLAVALGSALPAVAVTLVFVAVVLFVLRRTAPVRARLRTVPLLDGSRACPRGFRQEAPPEVGGLATDVRLGSGPRWQPMTALVGDVLSTGLRRLPENVVLAVLAFLPALLLLAPTERIILRWLRLEVLPPGVLEGPALAVGFELIHTLLFAYPLLAGALAVRNTLERAGSRPTATQVVIRAVRRLGSFLLAQTRVLAIGLAILLLPSWLALRLSPWLLVLAMPASAAALGWWLLCTALVGPVAFLEERGDPLRRSLFLTRGLRGWIAASLLLLGFSVLVLETTGEALLVALPGGFPPIFLGLVGILLRLVLAPIVGEGLAAMYRNARVLREGADVRPDDLGAPVPPRPVIVTRRWSWAIASALVVGSLLVARLGSGDPAWGSGRHNGPGLAVHEAIESGELARARELVRSGDRLVYRGPDGETLLHEAAGTGDLDLIAALVDTGADVNARTDSGATPLDLASNMLLLDERRARRVMRYLEGHGATRNQPSFGDALEDVLRDLRPPASNAEAMRRAAEAAARAGQ